MRRKNERYNEPVVRGVVAQLRELRHARNLSQKQVFTDTDINIGRIESGRGNISVSTLADLCAYYGIPLREFSNGSKPESLPENDTPHRRAAAGRGKKTKFPLPTLGSGIFHSGRDTTYFF